MLISVRLLLLGFMEETRLKNHFAVPFDTQETGPESGLGGGKTPKLTSIATAHR